MRCPKCDFEQPEGSPECARCGVIFRKARPGNLPPVSSSGHHAAAGEEEPGAGHVIRELLFGSHQEVNPFYFAGRVLVFIGLVILGIQYILAGWQSNYPAGTFLHGVNLAFHEAGHLLFRPFGRFMTVLGGSLGQLLMPLICMAVFLIKSRDPFGASVAFWWLGQSFLDLAPYIGDARALRLILLGGITGRDAVDYHDWEFLLKQLGLLQWDRTLAFLAHGFGSLCILSAMLWGAYLLFNQYKHMRGSAQ
ncbi:MAG: zinc ribbon domain-containing protein [Thermodesulfobacteriota bacterium]